MKNITAKEMARRSWEVRKKKYPKGFMKEISKKGVEARRKKIKDLSTVVLDSNHTLDTM